MYDDPSRRDTDVERTIIETTDPIRPGIPPSGYPPPPPDDGGSRFQWWVLPLIGLAGLICFAIGIIAVILAMRLTGAPATPTQAALASATAPQQQSSPAASITPAETEAAEITATPTDEPTVTATASPTSSIPAVEIQPYCARYGESPVYVAEGKPIRLIWFWRATTAQLVQDHLDTATYTIILDGVEVIAQRQSDIEYDPSGSTVFPYVVRWWADVGVLEPGVHEASRGLYWTEEISDGVDTFGPGAEYETLYDTCTIIVE